MIARRSQNVLWICREIVETLSRQRFEGVLRFARLQRVTLLNALELVERRTEVGGVEIWRLQQTSRLDALEWWRRCIWRSWTLSWRWNLVRNNGEGLRTATAAPPAASITAARRTGRWPKNYSGRMTHSMANESSGLYVVRKERERWLWRGWGQSGIYPKEWERRRRPFRERREDSHADRLNDGQNNVTSWERILLPREQRRNCGRAIVEEREKCKKTALIASECL